MNPNTIIDRDTRVRIWKAGTSLGSSWTTFGDERQKKKQIFSRGTPQSPMYIENMLADIWGSLFEGSLVAMGFCVHPKTSDGPVRIPADSFSAWQRPDLNNLMSDDVAAFGWKYKDVRILEFSEYSALIVETQPRQDKSDRHTMADGGSSTLSTGLKRGGGKISLYPKAKIIFERLFKVKPHLNDAVAAKITEHFNEIYRSVYFPEGEKFAPLKERTIRTHLKRYRQELANIGTK